MAKRPTWRTGLTPDERRRDADAMRDADAYNAGWRRGRRGQAPESSRYGQHPEFKRGYEDGQRARMAN